MKTNNPNFEYEEVLANLPAHLRALVAEPAEMFTMEVTADEYQAILQMRHDAKIQADADELGFQDALENWRWYYPNRRMPTPAEYIEAKQKLAALDARRDAGTISQRYYWSEVERFEYVLMA